MKCTLILAAITSLPFVLATQYTVGVGKDETTGRKGLGFDPSVIHPIVGDTIVWEFRSGQHSVVQASFENPCVGIEGGINTGVQTVSDSLSVDAPGLPTYTVTVNSTDPLWFFDEAGGLCNQGAVLAVNPSSTQTAAAFVENAKKSPASSPTPSSSSSTDTASQTSPLPGSATQTSPGAATTSNAAGVLASSNGLLLGALSFLALGFFKF